MATRESPGLVQRVHMSSSEPDVIVIGSGVTGLSAAIEAAVGGARVLVLEAAAAIGGASVMTGAACRLVR